jgi:hypothetical protein
MEDRAVTWELFDPDPEYPALCSVRSGRALVQVHAYLLGQARLQVYLDCGSEGREDWVCFGPEL